MKHFTALEISKMYAETVKNKLNHVMTLANGVYLGIRYMPAFVEFKSCDNLASEKITKLNKATINACNVPEFPKIENRKQSYTWTDKDKAFFQTMRHCKSDDDSRKSMQGLLFSDSKMGFSDGRILAINHLADKIDFNGSVYSEVFPFIDAVIDEQITITHIFKQEKEGDVDYKRAFVIESESLLIYVPGSGSSPNFQNVVPAKGFYSEPNISGIQEDFKKYLYFKDEFIHCIPLAFEDGIQANTFKDQIIYMPSKSSDLNILMHTKTFKKVYKTLDYATGKAISCGELSPQILEMDYLKKKVRVKNKLTEADYLKRILELEKQIEEKNLEIKKLKGE